jgi:uncharacterized membrane protein
MGAGEVLGFVSVFGGGLLGGEEFVIRYGVRGPLARLEQEPHIRMRQGLIRTLRILVPSIFLPTLLSAVTVTVVDGADSGLAFRCAAILALLAWGAVTIRGTVPINEAAIEWDPAAPPANWRAVVDRWEDLNTVRAWLAIVAFALLLAGLVLSLLPLS